MRSPAFLSAILLAAAATAQTSGPVDPAALSATVKELASDSFEGRDQWLASGMETGVEEGYAKLDALVSEL